jgi:hypothetical protein
MSHITLRSSTKCAKGRFGKFTKRWITLYPTKLVYGLQELMLSEFVINEVIERHGRRLNVMVLSTSGLAK